MHDDREEGSPGDDGHGAESAESAESAEWPTTEEWDEVGGELDAALAINPSAIVIDPLAIIEGGQTRRRAVGQPERTLRGALERFASCIRATSWQLAWYDRDLRDDLEQEGRIALWRMDPVRLSAAANPDAYQRAAIRHAMLRYLRTLDRQDPSERRIDWRIVQEVLETFGERWGGRRRAA